MSAATPLPAPPGSTGEAIAMVRAGLACLAQADAASLTLAELAGLLRELERGGSQLVASRAQVLAAFTAQAGYEADGHGGPRPWLIWQTQVTKSAARGALGGARRVAAHPLAGEPWAGPAAWPPTLWPGPL
jgi:hypothetical protein